MPVAVNHGQFWAGAGEASSPRDDTRHSEMVVAGAGHYRGVIAAKTVSDGEVPAGGAGKALLMGVG